MDVYNPRYTSRVRTLKYISIYQQIQVVDALLYYLRNSFEMNNARGIQIKCCEMSYPSKYRKVIQTSYTTRHTWGQEVLVSIEVGDTEVP